MESVDLETVRLFLHVLAATIWVGGQLVLAALVPVLRGVAPDAPRAAARQFARIAWPAFAVLVLTGIWNVAEMDASGARYRTTLTLKLVAVLLSGLTAWGHQRASSRRALALLGAGTGVFALLALFLGIVLAQ